jgi:hypothetical protein
MSVNASIASKTGIIDTHHVVDSPIGATTATATATATGAAAAAAVASPSKTGIIETQHVVDVPIGPTTATATTAAAAAAAATAATATSATTSSLSGDSSGLLDEVESSEKAVVEATVDKVTTDKALADKALDEAKADKALDEATTDKALAEATTDKAVAKDAEATADKALDEAKSDKAVAKDAEATADKALDKALDEAKADKAVAKDAEATAEKAVAKDAEAPTEKAVAEETELIDKDKERRDPRKYSPSRGISKTYSPGTSIDVSKYRPIDKGEKESIEESIKEGDIADDIADDIEDDIADDIKYAIDEELDSKTLRKPLFDVSTKVDYTELKKLINKKDPTPTLQDHKILDSLLNTKKYTIEEVLPLVNLPETPLHKINSNTSILLSDSDIIKEELSNKDVKQEIRRWKRKLIPTEISLIDKIIGFYMKTYPTKMIKKVLSSYSGSLDMVITFLHSFKSAFQNKSTLRMVALAF